MNCPNCGNEMVDGKFYILQAGPAVAALPDATQNRLLGTVSGPRANVSNGTRMKICNQCGLVQLFVDDPTIFREQETQGLPRPATHMETGAEDLPRVADPEIEK